MKTHIYSIIWFKNDRKVIFTIGLLCLLTLVSIFPIYAQGEKGKKTGQETTRLSEAQSIQQVQGRIDSLRLDKIVITYEPEGQEGSLIQTYFLRGKDIKFTNCEEKNIKPGDIAEITYVETTWVNEDGRRQIQRTAREIRLIRERKVEELLEQKKPAAIKRKAEIEMFKQNGDKGPQ